MSSRIGIQQIVSTTQPVDAAVGDEWFNPSTGKLYKNIALGGTQVGFLEVPLASQPVNITNTSNSVSTATGALLVQGGVGVAGNLYVGGTIYGSISGSITSANQVNTQAQSASATYYPAFVNANNSSATPSSIYTTSSFTVNPATGFATIGTATPIGNVALTVVGGGVHAPAIVANGNPDSYADTGGTMLSYANGVGSICVYSNTNGSGATSINFITSGTAQMTLNSFGQLGVGTTTPANLLDVSSTGTNYGVNITKANSGFANQNGGALNFYNYGPIGSGRNAGTLIGQIYFGASQPVNGAIQDAAAIKIISENQTGVNTPSAMAFFTSVPGSSGVNAEAMRIDASGNVNITTTTNYSGAKLSVNGGAYVNGTFTATTIVENGYAVVSQRDIGSSPNQVPLNQYLGSMAYQDQTAISVGTVNFTGVLGVGTATNYGTAGQVLQSNGSSSSPSWVSTVSLATTASTAITATQINTVIQTANANYYPTFVSANNASATGMSEYTTSSFTINPSNGALSVGYTAAQSGALLSVNGSAYINGVVTATTFAGTATSAQQIQTTAQVDSVNPYYLTFVNANNASATAGALYTSSTVIVRPGTGQVSILGTTSTATNKLQLGQSINGGTFTGTTHLRIIGNANTATQDIFINLVRDRNPGIQFAGAAAMTLGSYITPTAATAPGSRLSFYLKNTSDNSDVANVQVMSLLDTGYVGVGYQIPVGGELFGVNGGGYFNGIVTATTYYGTFAGTIGSGVTLSTATNAATAYSTIGVHSTGTGFFGGSFNGSAPVTWSLNTATLMASAVTATNAAYAYSFNTNTLVTYAVNLSGGANGGIPYQNNSNSTVFLPISATVGAIQASNGATPYYNNTVTVIVNGVGSASGNTGQSLRVAAGGLGVTGDSYFANNLGIGGTVTFGGQVVFNGTSTYVFSTQTVYTDNIIELHTPSGGVYTPWFADDGKDIGFRFHYYANSTDTNAALVLANDSKYLEWYSSGAESASGVFTGSITYGIFKTGGIRLVGGAVNTGNTASGDLQVLGGVGIGNNLYVAGNVTVGGTLSATLTGTASTATSAGTAYATIGVLSTGTGFFGGSFNGSAPVTWSLNTATLMASAVTGFQVLAQAQPANATYYPTFVNANNASATASNIYTTSSFALNPATGFIGVGTSTPVSILGVNYSIPTSASAIPGNVASWPTQTTLFGNAGSSTGQALGVGMTTSGTFISSLTPSVTWNNIYYNALNQFWTNSGNLTMSLTSGGYLGLGYSSPIGGALLSVNGGAYINGVVTANSGAYINGVVTATGVAYFSSSVSLNEPAPLTYATTGSLVITNTVFRPEIALRTNTAIGSTTALKLGVTSQVPQGGAVISSYTTAVSGQPTDMLFQTMAGGGLNERLRITSNGGFAFNGASNYGSSGQLLQSNGDATPSWVSASGVTAGSATTATSAGTAYSTIGVHSTGTGFFGGSFNGSAPVTWSLNTATLMASAVSASNATQVLAQAQSSNATYYPAFVNANNASATASNIYTTSSFALNPATGFIGVGVSTPPGSLGNASFYSLVGITAVGTATAQPYIHLYNPNAGANLKTWRWGLSDNTGAISFQTINDAYSASTEYLKITATGQVGVGSNYAGTSGALLAVNGGTYINGITTVTNSIVQSGGYAYLGNYNSGTPTYPSSPVAGGLGLAFALNFSAGNVEQNIWNTTQPSTYGGTGIRFMQYLTASTYRDLLFLSNTGAVGFGGAGNYGSSGQILQSNGNAAPTWVPASGVTAGSATTATSAGTAYSTIGVHSTGTGFFGGSFNGSAPVTWSLNTATLMASAVSAGSVVNSLSTGTGLFGGAYNGSSAQTFSLNTATLMASAVNLAGGAGGQVAIQSNVNATTFISTGSLYVGRAVVADSAAGGSAQVNTVAQTANATYYPTFVSANNASAAAMSVYTTSSFAINPATGFIGIGTVSPGYNLQVNGSFAATTKSFVIDHPTRSGMKLRYGSLEGPENGVYVRGRLTNSNTIQLPDYWVGLVDESSITVDLTPIGKYQKLFVKDIGNNTVVVGNDNLFNNAVNCFYTVWAERKDVAKLVVEISNPK